MNIPLPSKKDISHLAGEVQRQLDLSPARNELTPDIKQILGGLSNVANGIGTLRTHAGDTREIRHPEFVTLLPSRLGIADAAADRLAICSLLHIVEIRTVQAAWQYSAMSHFGDATAGRQAVFRG